MMPEVNGCSDMSGRVVGSGHSIYEYSCNNVLITTEYSWVRLSTCWLVSCYNIIPHFFPFQGGYFILHRLIVFITVLYSNYINCNYYIRNAHRVSAHIYMDVNLDIWTFSTDIKCHLSWPNMFQLAHHTCPDCCRISLHLYKKTSLSDCSDCSEHTHTDTERERERERERDCQCIHC